MAFDIRQTIISQYANSPVILGLLDRLAAALDATGNLDAFYRDVFDLDTARGYGLDLWGRIVGVSRVLRVPVSSALGWSEAGDAQSFGTGVWSGGEKLTENYALTDDAYRRLIYARAGLNITNCSIPAINRVLVLLFGDGFVRDNGNMTMEYAFRTPPSAVDRAIILQSGAIPKPAGVSVSIVRAG